jgi:hypothetical protein
MFSYQHLYIFFFFPVRATCPTHLIFLDMITLKVFDTWYQSWSPPFELSSLFEVVTLHPYNRMPQAYILFRHLSPSHCVGRYSVLSA